MTAQLAHRLEMVRGLRLPETSGDVASLPEPARRYLSRANEGPPPTTSGCRLRMRGSVLRNDRRLALEADETLVPGQGFHWRARARLGPVVVTVTDYYLRGDSRVDVRAFGVVPMGGERGPDTVASSRGRLAAESVWAPWTLMPRAGVRWSAADADTAVVHLDIDGVEESVQLRVDGEGRLLEVSMQRWGDVDVAEPARLPYGFRVVEERSFGGVRIPSRLEGGWWYGSDRYRPEHASRFIVEKAQID